MEERIYRGSTQEEDAEPVGEWVQSETRDLADAARERMYAAKECTAEAKEYVRDAVQQTREYVDDAREYIGEAVQQARGKLTAYGDEGMAKVRHNVVGYTREQPITALLIAVGAGLLIGWLSSTERR